MSYQDHPTQIEFGAGCLDHIVRILADTGLKHAAILCGNWVLKSDCLQRITAQLNELGIQNTLLEGIPQEPYSDDVDRFAQNIRQAKADLIIAVGGGSVLDLAKFAAYLAIHPGQCGQFDGGPAINGPGLPMLLIPTTAGTGSEVTPYSVINHSETGKKFTISSPHFYPKWAVIDAQLTRSLPPRFRLATGLDAWVHCFEAYLSAAPSDLADGHALTGLRLVFDSLGQAMQDPQDVHLEALAHAALAGGLAISHSRTGLIHTASVALAKYCDLPHGLLNAVITPYVLHFNQDSYNQERLLELLPHCETGLQVIEAICRFLKNLGVPQQLNIPRCDEDLIQALITRVRMDGGLAAVNPKPIGDNDLRQLFNAIIAGEC